MDAQIQQVVQSNSAIINSLNADCWRLILDYLSIKELLQTELTCKDWQKLVLDHISHRPIVIHSMEIDENTLILKQSSEAWCSFKRWARKCGGSVQDFDMDCNHYKDAVETLRDHCPNLVGLKLSRLKKKLSPTDTLHFQKLTWLVFDCCDEVTDDCVSQFLTNSLEELRITYNKRVTGRFLNNLKPVNNMKSLGLKHCRALRFPFLLSAADRLSNLTVLELWKRNRSKIEIRDKLHLLFEKMPNLREIDIEIYDMLRRPDEEIRLAESNVFFESICRLKKLTRVNANFQVWDNHLEALASSCKQLMGVDLICNHITRRGLDALCRHVGARLLELNLAESLLTDDDVAACVYACPKLLSLDLSDCPRLVWAVRRVALARRAMRRSPRLAAEASLRLPLPITMSRWDFYGDADDFKDVVDVRFTSDGYSSVERQY
ncbi:uncharacterized protein LOC133531871 isoform X2 [Cydia pomonella]|uniref:uncharacterized protein LOC133531871 isoform X2 n=1 Tax=Cydia pomonella TaxID=82600 RepID=UPI002ADD50D7|nr:uncharacterized protein LOC133531871 isoform X2 [Cydia pomonella]